MADSVPPQAPVSPASASLTANYYMIPLVDIDASNNITYDEKKGILFRKKDNTTEFGIIEISDTGKKLEVGIVKGPENFPDAQKSFNILMLAGQTTGEISVKLLGKNTITIS